MTRKVRITPTLATASIIAGELYFEDARQCRLSDDIASDILEDPYLTAIRVVSLSHNWQLDVHYADVTITEDINTQMTLRKELRGKKFVWYAYRRVFGKLHKRYVGGSDQLSDWKLIQIARAMPSS